MKIFNRIRKPKSIKEDYHKYDIMIDEKIFGKYDYLNDSVIVNVKDKTKINRLPIIHLTNNLFMILINCQFNEIVDNVDHKNKIIKLKSHIIDQDKAKRLMFPINEEYEFDDHIQLKNTIFLMPCV